MKKEIICLQAMSELGAGKRGCGLGLESLKVVASELKDPFFKKHPFECVAWTYEAYFEEEKNYYLRKTPHIHDFCRRLKEKVCHIAEQGKVAFVITGDHSSALGIGAGLKSAKPHQSLGIVWVDAHFDIHSPFTTPSGNAHGMPIAAMLRKDNKALAINPVSASETAEWERLKSIYDVKNAIIEGKNLVYIGARSYEDEELQLVNAEHITDHNVIKSRKQGIQAMCSQTLSQLAHCEQIYISFDVDSIDAKESDGTGTPVEGGFTVEETKEILRRLVLGFGEKIACFEITEINPTLDTKNRTSKVVFPIIKEVMGLLER